MIGLYSNVPEGGVIKQDQIGWLESELSAALADKALVVSVHHPTFSGDTAHGGSMTMLNTLDAAFEEAGRHPDMVLRARPQLPAIHQTGSRSGHPLYRGRRRRLLEPVQDAEQPGWDSAGGSVSHGRAGRYSRELLRRPSRLPQGAVRGRDAKAGEYYGVTESTQPNPGQAPRLDTFVIDLTQHKVTASKRRP